MTKSAVTLQNEILLEGVNRLAEMRQLPSLYRYQVTCLFARQILSAYMSGNLNIPEDEVIEHMRLIEYCVELEDVGALVSTDFGIRLLCVIGGNNWQADRLFIEVFRELENKGPLLEIISQRAKIHCQWSILFNNLLSESDEFNDVILKCHKKLDGSSLSLETTIMNKFGIFPYGI